MDKPAFGAPSTGITSQPKHEVGEPGPAAETSRPEKLQPEQSQPMTHPGEAPASRRPQRAWPRCSD